MNEKFKDVELTEKIIGCAMRVHSALGNGFQEVIYQRALAIEFANINLAFTRELEMTIYYQSKEVGTRRVDFLVENKIMVELKAIILLEKVHLSQIINYLEAYKLETGLLINFGEPRLKFHRITNEKKLLKSLSQ